MLILVFARVGFGLGFLALMALLAGTSGAIALVSLVAYVLVCEYIFANRIKSTIAPKLTRNQKSLALLPWFLPIAGLGLAMALL